MLDVRASEDQGADLSISIRSFDRKMPMNTNDTDIEVDSKQMPMERHGVTDTSFARIATGTTNIMRQLMASGTGNAVIDPPDQSHLLNEIHQVFEQGYFQHTSEPANEAYPVAVTIARLVMEKMRLIVIFPRLFAAPTEQVSNEIRTNLLFSAVQVAEYNHVLNDKQAYQQWRWIYQTRTHWHAIV